MKQNDIYKDISDLTNHVIILGFGRVGQMVARLLEAENVNYIAIDINSEHVASERVKGHPIYLGDASNVDMMNAIAMDRAGSVIITLSNEVTLKKISKTISNLYPQLPIVVRAKDLSKSKEYYSAGVSEFEVSRIKNQFRAGNYIKLPKIGEEL